MALRINKLTLCTCILIQFLSVSAYAGTITIQMPDASIRSQIIYVCQPGRIDCNGLKQGEVVMQAIDSFLARTGFSPWQLELARLLMPDIIKVTIEYSDD